MTLPQATTTQYSSRKLDGIEDRLRHLERTGPTMRFAPYRFYRPLWASSFGTNPDIGDGEIAGWWTVCNAWRVARGVLRIGPGTQLGAGAEWVIGMPDDRRPAGMSGLAYGFQAVGQAAIRRPDGLVYPAVCYSTTLLSIDDPPAIGHVRSPSKGAFRIVPAIHGTDDNAEADPDGGTSEVPLGPASFDWSEGWVVTWNTTTHVGPHPVKL